MPRRRVPPAGSAAQGEVGAHGDLRLTASEGNASIAYEAHPATPSTRGIVILSDIRGLHEHYEQLAEPVAAAGFHAVALDYFGRTAERASPVVARWGPFRHRTRKWDATGVGQMRVFAAVPTARAAAQTPPDRDRVVDGARAAALLVVVVGHVVMAVVAWPDGVPVLGNLLAAYPWTQALTWIMQIMPLFFFAGGAANALSYDRHHARGGDYASWLWGRGRRLLRPVWVYLAVMAVIATVVTLLAPAKTAEPLMMLTTQLLWFLGAYLLVTALAPLLRGTSRRGGVLGLLLLLGLVAVIDLARFALGLPEAIALFNFVLAWAVPAYLGALRARGTLGRYRWPVLVAAVALAFTANAVLIRYGPYPVSMVGMPGEPVSNMAPPTLVLAIHSVVLAVVVTLLDAPLRRLLARPRVWRPVTGVNLVAMTLYLWHLPVLITVFTLTHALHLDRPVTMGADGYPVPAGWGYLLGSVVFIAAYVVGVWAVVRLLWPLEHAPLVWWDAPLRGRRPSPRAAAVVACVATLLIGISTLVISATGLGGFPTRTIEYAGLPLNAAAAIAVLLAAGAALRWAGGDRVHEQV